MPKYLHVPFTALRGALLQRANFVIARVGRGGLDRARQLDHTPLAHAWWEEAQRQPHDLERIRREYGGACAVGGRSVCARRAATERACGVAHPL